MRLLKEAGYEMRNQKLVNAKTGEPLTVEILSQTADPSVERIILFYKPSLERLGVTVTVRTVDDVQYENRLRNWDFDIIIASWPQSLSPGNEQRDFWGSPAADTPGSRNLRRHQEPGGRCADRAGHLRQGSRRTGRRHQGARPRAACGTTTSCRNGPTARCAPRAGIVSAVPIALPKYGAAAFPTVWWWDAEKAAKAGRASDQVSPASSPAATRSCSAPARWQSAVRRAGAAQAGAERHGMSAFGDLKYPADFKHFDYVNPNAPKGGVFSHIGSTRAFNQNFLTFNSLNSFILKGDGAQGMELTFASLMVRAEDEPDAMYGLAARAVRDLAPTGSTYRFLMRPGVKFHDGSPLTAHDVAFSLKILKDKGHPIAQQLLRDFAGAEAVDDATVVVRFAPQRGARRAAVRGVAADLLARLLSANRPFDETTLEVPLGCGPYKVGRFEAGRYIEYERVKDWWGADLPVSRGQQQFRRRALRILSRPRRRLRRLHRQELPVPRGVHLAHLGDALRLSGDPRRPRQARRAARTKRRPARRAGSSTRGARSSRTGGCARP